MARPIDYRTTPLLENLIFPEGPRWRDGRLVFSDMHDHRVVAVGLDGRSETLVETPGACSGLGWTPDGRMLVVSMDDHTLLRLDPEGLEVVADLSGLASSEPINDMVVDRAGRAYIGQFGFDFRKQQDLAPTDLLRVDPDGTAQIAASDLLFPNGMVLTPEGDTLIVAETFGARLTAFDVAKDGELSGRRLFAELGKAIPDGICLDAEGCVWVASPMGNWVVRVREGGKVVARAQTTQPAIACMLGGDDRRTLFVATSSSTEAEECQRLRAARIETADVAVAGAGLP